MTEPHRPHQGATAAIARTRERHRSPARILYRRQELTAGLADLHSGCSGFARQLDQGAHPKRMGGAALLGGVVDREVGLDKHRLVRLDEPRHSAEVVPSLPHQLRSA
jgi:hypothetical protein